MSNELLIFIVAGVASISEALPFISKSKYNGVIHTAFEVLKGALHFRKK